MLKNQPWRMSKREQIQQEALERSLKLARAGLGISMGVGKTLIGLRYLEHLWKNGTMQRALVVAPKLSIFGAWDDDAIRFEIDKGMMAHLTFSTYLSLTRHHPGDYDVIVLDECHSLLDTHKAFLEPFRGRILGLTGTPPRYAQSEKGRMVARYCPIVYEYITDDAVEDRILNDYRILVHVLPLGIDRDLHVKTQKAEFRTSELQNYQYWTQRLERASTKREEKMCSVMRMHALMRYSSKERYTRKLLSSIHEKCIVFCNTQDQADHICAHSYHSGNPESSSHLEMFKSGTIDKLSCVLQLSEGVNIPHLRSGIIMHAYGNERKSSQRIGRLLRLNPDDRATIHILCYRDTIDERWVREALRDLDASKISYVDGRRFMIETDEYEHTFYR